MLENLGIRVLVADAKLQYKDIARYMGISPEYLSRCMRHKLNPIMRIRILSAINDLIKLANLDMINSRG